MPSDVPSEWKRVALGDVVELLAGFAFKSADFTADSSGVRLLRGDNVAQGQVRWDNVKRWRRAPGDKLERYELRPGDVVLAMDRPWIDAGLKYAVIADTDVPALLVQRVARLRARDGLDQRYLSYVIADPAFTQYVRAVQTGTAIPHISGGQILSYETLLPPVKEQRRIARVLSALEEKAAVNRRLAARLDALVQTLFERMGMPPDAEEHPDGWRQVRVDEVATVNEKSYSARLHPEVIRYVDISSVRPREVIETRELAFADAPSRARRIVRSGDTLISTVRPERRALAFVPVAASQLTASTGFAVLSPHAISPVFLYRATTSDRCIQHLTATATGSAYPAVNPTVLAGWTFWLPDDGGERFERAAAPLEALRWQLFEENRRLASIRSSLLPKLLRDQLSVDGQVEAAVAA